MKQSSKAIFIGVGVFCLVIAVCLWMYPPFLPSLLTRQSRIENRPDLVNVEFAKCLSRTLNKNNTDNFRFGPVVFAQRSKTANIEIRAKYSREALFLLNRSPEM